jgi:hypothetical protein
MFEWSFAASEFALLSLTALNLVLALLRRFQAAGLGSMVLAEIVMLLNLILAGLVVAGGEGARTSTLEYFFYGVCALLVPLAAVAWTLVQRASAGLYVYSIASFTLFVMVFRMHQIWFGA